MRKIKIFGLLVVLLSLALVTGCTPITDTPEVPEEKTYTVTIASGITNGTVSTDKTSAKAGETVKLTVTPKNDDYELTNLIVVDSSSTTITITSNTFVMPESNVTVDATFTAKIKHTVTFDSKGGSEITSKTIIHGDKITRPDDPTKQATASETYTFDNWYTSDDNGTTLSETAFNFDTPITSDITLYAKWAVNAVTHEVKFVSDGETIDTKTIIYGNKVEKPADPTKDETEIARFTFDNWYTSTDNGVTLSETAFNFDTAITSDITLYAKWDTTALYSITIASSTNGTVTAGETSKITAGETITLTVSPNTSYELDTLSVKKGDVDITVTQDSSDVTKYTFTMPDGNVTVDASFKESVMVCTVSFKVNVNNNYYDMDNNVKTAICNVLRDRNIISSDGKMSFSVLKTREKLLEEFEEAVQYCYQLNQAWFAVASLPENNNLTNIHILYDISIANSSELILCYSYANNLNSLNTIKLK